MKFIKKYLNKQRILRNSERNKRLRTSCSPAVGRGYFKILEREDGGVQPITANMMKKLGYMKLRVSITLFLFFLLLFQPVGLIAQGTATEAGSDAELPYVWVEDVDRGGFAPPAGTMELLKPLVERSLLQAGICEISETDGKSDVQIQMILENYTLSEASELGIVAELDLQLSLSGLIEDSFSLRTSAAGKSAAAAVQRAVGEVGPLLLYRLRETALWVDGVRVLDRVGGKAVLDRGSADGIRKGAELFHEVEGRSSLLLKVFEVYETFSEAEPLIGGRDYEVGTRLTPAQRAGLRISSFSRYLLIRRDLYEVGQPASVTHGLSAGLRVYFERGLYWLNPFIGADYLFETCRCFDIGTSLNWRFGRMNYAPAAGFQMGLPDGGGEAFYWGGFVELALQVLLFPRVALSADLGFSNLYYGGTEHEDLQFLYSGIGLILKL